MATEKIALCIAAADGIQSLQTGVGIVVRSFFEAYEDIKVTLPFGNPDLYAFCPKVLPESTDYCTETTTIVDNVCRDNNGKLVSLENITSGRSLNEIWKGTGVFSPVRAWESCCNSLGTVLDCFALKYEKVFVLLHDTLFADVASCVTRSNIKICWIPHSLGTLFNDPAQKTRINFEQTKLAVLLGSGHRVGYVSDYTREHLQENYGVSETSMLPFYSGIYYHSSKYTDKVPEKRKPGCLPVKKGKKIIFSWGRCSEQKGIDIVIEAFSRLLNTAGEAASEWHLFLICPTETSYDSYKKTIEKLLNMLPPDTYTFITAFEKTLPYEILRSDSTKVIALCSRYESLGLTSLEALYMRNCTAEIIYAPIPTYREIFSGIPLCSELKENTAAHLCTKFIEAIKKTDDPAKPDGSALRYQSAKYSLVNSYSGGLNSFITKNF